MKRKFSYIGGGKEYFKATSEIIRLLSKVLLLE